MPATTVLATTSSPDASHSSLVWPIHQRKSNGSIVFPAWSAATKGAGVLSSGDTNVVVGHPIEVAGGSWAKWRWDGSALTASNDDCGFLPLFYSRGVDDSTIAISTSPLQLLADGIQPTVDYGALGVFLRLGFFLGEDTPFREIRTLPPGSTLSWRPGSFSIRTKPRTVSRYAGRRSAAVDDFISAFRIAIEKRPPSEDFVLPLSGGRDSRHILLELIRQGHAPRRCVTLGFAAGKVRTDERVAGEFAQALGVPHTVLPRRIGRRVVAEFEKNVLTHMCADEHDWFMPLAAYLREATNCTYSGVAGTWEPDGGTALTESISTLFDAGNVEDVADGLLQHFDADEARLSTLLTREQLRVMPREEARQRIVDELARHADAPNPLGSFWFWNRERREHGLAAHGVLGAIPTVHLPYLDHDVVSLLTSLPTEFFRGPSFHTDAILRGYPEVAHLPFAEFPTSLVARDRASDRIRAVADVATYAIRHNPRRLQSVAQFTVGRALGADPMNLRMLAYVTQLESISAGIGPGPDLMMRTGTNVCRA